MKARAPSSLLLFSVFAAAVLTPPGDNQPGKAAASVPEVKLRRAPAGKIPAGNISASFARLRLSFEANQGQTDAQVKFLSRGRGYTLFLTPAEAVLALARPADVAHGAPDGIYPDQVGSPAQFHVPASLPTASGQVPGGAARAEPAVLRMKLVGAKARPHVEGLKELPGKSNYFLGNDPKKWRRNVPTYAKVKYDSVYPGVDLVYYGNQQQLEHDFVVAPGADPGAIRLGFEGWSGAQQAAPLQIDDRGDLVVHLSHGEMRLQKPIIYQDLAGVRQEVSGGYVLKGDREVGFQLGAYDPRRPLVIDPVFVYSTYLGGSGDDFAEGIAVDAEGNAYVIGSTTSRDFPTANALQPNYGGGSIDAFVAKLNPDGSALVYSTYLGGSGGDQAFGVTVDAEGNAYVTGETDSRDFPTVNALQPEFGGFIDAFVAKLSPDGSALVYSTYLGGSNLDIATSIAVDLDGNAYLTGATISTNFPTANPLQPEFAGGDNDGFVTKLSPDGSALVYSTYLGGSGGDFGQNIALDLEGNAYVTGSTNSTDFPTANPLQPNYGGGDFDAFVAKLSPDGSALVYSTYVGGNGHDTGSAIAVDADGNAYITGATRSLNFPLMNPLQPDYGGGVLDAFVAKLDPTGTALIYSTYLGGSRSDGSIPIAVDREGNAYVAGQTASTDFPTADALQPNYGGGPFDVFLSVLNSDGSALVYSTYLGGSSFETAHAITVDTEGTVYVAGVTSSSNFPTANALQPDSGGFDDAFVAKIAPVDPSCKVNRKLQTTRRRTQRHRHQGKERR